MSTYDTIVNQAQENLERTTQRWAQAQEQTVAFVDEATKRFQSVLPLATEAVESNYRLAAETFQAQRDLTLKWLELFQPTPSTSGKGAGKAS